MTKPAILSDTSKSAKSIAQNIAKQVAEEPLEILKNAGAQMVGSEAGWSGVQTAGQPDSQTSSGQPDNGVSAQQKLEDQTFAQRQMQALQREINDIRKQGIFKDLQARISNGEYIPLQDYPELSMEQKQVLKAQIEAVKIQQTQAKYQANLQEVPTVHSKPSRRFGAGQKHEAERAQTRVEKPVPPSG